ncbi:MAG: MCE family protein [Azospirillum sp.]|nr:MCE family protein [Azospirillum sp.]
MTSTNLKVGLFVLAALALIIAGALALGLGAWFRPSIRAETYIDESVQGLDLGSPVKYRGVQIGSVSGIDFVSGTYPIAPDHPNFIKYSKLVLVHLSLQPDIVNHTAVGHRRITVDDLVREGLRVRMASQGLTGTAYLEMDILDPEKFEPIQIAWTPWTLYIPSAPSVISRLSSSAEGVIGNLERTDLAHLADQIGSLSEQASGLIGELRVATKQIHELAADPAIKAVIHDSAGTMAAIRSVAEAGDREIPPTLAGLREAAAQFSRLGAGLADDIGRGQIAHLVHRLDEITDELRRTAAQLPGIVAGAEQTMRRVDGIVVGGQRAVSTTLDNLAAMSKNLRSFSETAARYPSQILFGGPPSQTTPSPSRGNR